jgi:hypothetical protein
VFCDGKLCWQAWKVEIRISIKAIHNAIFHDAVGIAAIPGSVSSSINKAALSSCEDAVHFKQLLKESFLLQSTTKAQP